MNIADPTHGYVAALDLPEPAPQYESNEGPVQFDDATQAVVIGAQIAQFSPALAAPVRSAVADSLLIAQLAANKAADHTQDVMAWFRKYNEVLQNLGWIVGDLVFREEQVRDTDAGVHTAIVPVVTAMLGPGAAALSLVLPVLNGLQEMNAGSKWITVFNRASQHARGAKFQLSQVDADDQGDPVISTLCFGFLAEHTLTQVLFFKFADDRVSMKSGHGRLSMNRERLEAARGVIAQRVSPFIVDFVKDLAI